MLTDAELYEIERWMGRVDQGRMTSRGQHGVLAVAFRHMERLIADLRERNVQEQAPTHAEGSTAGAIETAQREGRAAPRKPVRTQG